RCRGAACKGCAPYTSTSPAAAASSAGATGCYPHRDPCFSSGVRHRTPRELPGVRGRSHRTPARSDLSRLWVALLFRDLLPRTLLSCGSVALLTALPSLVQEIGHGGQCHLPDMWTQMPPAGRNAGRRSSLPVLSESIPADVATCSFHAVAFGSRGVSTAHRAR